MPPPSGQRMHFAGLEALLQHDGLVGQSPRAAVETVEKCREEVVRVDLAQQVDVGDVWRLHGMALS